MSSDYPKLGEMNFNMATSEENISNTVPCDPQRHGEEEGLLMQYSSGSMYVSE